MAPISAADGSWDGGVAVTARTSEIAQQVAQLVNNLCIAGAAGTQRLEVYGNADQGTTLTNATRQGNGRRRGQGNGRPPVRI